MGNQQLCTLEEEQLIISGILGDGCVYKAKDCLNMSIKFECIYKEYLNFKQSLITSLKNTEIKERINNGYKNNKIYSLYLGVNPLIDFYFKLSLEEKLNKLNELGLALWIYDDGSLHKEKLFYNLCTHSFTKEDNLIIIDFLNKKFNIKASLRTENKKDGRVFYYISINKFSGSDKINTILNKYKIECFSYKLWSSQTSQEWRTLEDQWKRGPLDTNFKSYYLKNKSKEDIVESTLKNVAS